MIQLKKRNYLREIVLDEISRVGMNIIRDVSRGLTNNSYILVLYVSSNPKQIQIIKALNSSRVELTHEHKESARDPNVDPPPEISTI